MSTTVSNRSLRFLLTLPALLLATAAMADNVSVKVTPGATHQKVGGIGGSMVYYQDWLTNHRNKEALYDTLFNGLGISCLRMGNWALEDSSNIDPDVEIYEKAREMCGGELTVLLTSWTPPASLKACNSLNGSNYVGKGSLKKVNGQFVYDQYAAWWKKSLLRYHQRGMYPDYVSIQNEPDMDASYHSMVLRPQATYDEASYGEALKAVAAQMDGMEHKPLFVGADNLGIGWNQPQDFINALDKSLLSGYAFHYYHSGVNTHDGTPRYSYPDDFIEAMRALDRDFADKPMWMTENSALRNSETNDAVNTAWFIANAFNINRVQYYLHWSLIWKKGEGCVTLDKWDEEQTSPLGFTTETDYHGLRHFSKFVRPGYLNIDTWASNSDFVTCGFADKAGDNCVVVLINHGQQTHTVSLTGVEAFEGDFFEKSVVLTVPASGIWSRQQTWTGSIDMPKYSIATVVFKRRVPSSLVFTDKSGDHQWSNAANWSPALSPLYFDTCRLKSGEAQLAAATTHTGPVYVDSAATLSMQNQGSVFNSMELNGGTIRSFTSNPYYALTVHDMQVTGDSRVVVGENSGSVFALHAAMHGTAGMEKSGEGELSLLTSSPGYRGWWHIKEGTLSVGNYQAVGTLGFEADSGVSVMIYPEYVITDSIVLHHGATLGIKGGTLTVECATLGGTALPNGTYTQNDFPGFIAGDGSLVVNFPYPWLQRGGSGDSLQTVNTGEPISSFYYRWENADTVTVDWTPQKPDGIDVEIDSLLRRVHFSGSMTGGGSYAYLVAARSHRTDSVFSLNGLLTAVHPTAVAAVEAHGSAIALQPNPACAGEKVVLSLCGGKMPVKWIRIFNPLGICVCSLSFDGVDTGSLSFTLPSLPPGVYIAETPVGTCRLMLK